ncbi:MAG: histidine kinase [Gemmatimonadaceae bacterium]
MTIAPPVQQPDTARLLVDPAGGRRLRLGILAFWTGMGLIESSKAYVAFQLRETPRSWAHVLIGNMPWWYIWALLTPVIFLLATRFRLDRAGWRRAVAIHFVAAMAVSFVHMTTTGVLFYYTTSRGSVIASLSQQIRLFVDNYLAVNVLTYCAVVGGYYVIDFYLRLREREVTAARLEAGMHEARLAVLRMELNPHFLFNALNSVAALVRRREHDAAVGALARIGDLLRLTLDRQAMTEAPLSDELTLVRQYLEIERLRFQDRLTLEEDVDPAALNALVPTLILQPLVENAVRHGVARWPGAGRISVRAMREGARLRLVVHNTGAGFTAASMDGVTRSPSTTGVTVAPARTNGTAGVGLSNTRARLAHLYGDRASLETRNGPPPDGGAEVVVLVPYHTERAASST